MNWLLLTITAILVVAASPAAEPERLATAPAAPTAGDTASAAIRSEINAANIRWVDATRRQDFALLAQMMAPDYVVTYHDGRRADLTTWIGRFRKIRMPDCGATIINLRVSSADAAEATVSAYWDAVLGHGEPFRETYVARDSWERRQGRWVVVRRDVVDMRLLD